MKIFITNQNEFKEEFQNSLNLHSSQIHKSLYNKVCEDLSINNKIEITVLIPYSEVCDGDAIFEFKGKNNDMFFYSFNGTVK